VVQVEIQLRTQAPTHLPTQVATQRKTPLPLLPAVLPRVLRAVGPPLRAGPDRDCEFRPGGHRCLLAPLVVLSSSFIVHRFWIGLVPLLAPYIPLSLFASFQQSRRFGFGLPRNRYWSHESTKDTKRMGAECQESVSLRFRVPSTTLRACFVAVNLGIRELGSASG